MLARRSVKSQLYISLKLITFKEKTRRQDSQCGADDKCKETYNRNNAHGDKNDDEKCSHRMLSRKLLPCLPFLLWLEKLVSGANHFLTLCDKIFCHVKHVISP